MSRRLKVALVTPYFPPNVGGIETYIYELAKRLAKNGVTVHVFTCGRGITEKYNGVKVYRLKAIDVQNLPISLKIPYPIPPTLMFKLVKSDVDIIHAHGHAFITSFEAALASQLAHKPFILTIHDVGVAYQDYMIMRGIRPIVDSTLVKYVFKQADMVIAQNSTTYNYALRFKPRRMTIIPQGIDTSKFKPSRKEGKYITFIAARLVPQKGGETFIRSIPIVIKEIRKVRFMVIGDGLQRSTLENLAYELGVEDYVEFIGRVPHNYVPHYLDQAKIVVFPSEIPAGLTLIEAAAMKKPIITSKTEWAIEDLGDAPIFIPTRNPSETAKAIIYLLRNPHARKMVAKLVYRRVLGRSWDRVVSRHIEIYNEVMMRRG